MFHLGRLRPYPQALDYARKALPGTNSLAYCEKSQLTAVKSFITLATDVSFIHLPLLVITAATAKEARVFVLRIFFSHVSYLWILAHGSQPE